MSIRVSCDDCGREFRVSDAQAGKRVKCTCGSPVRVPLDDEDEEFEDAPARRRSSKGRKSKSGNTKLAAGFLIGGGIAAALAIVAVIVIPMMNKGGPADQLVAQPQPVIPSPIQPGPHGQGAGTGTPTVIPTPFQPTTPSTPSNSHGSSNNTPTTPTTPTTPVKPEVKPVVPAIKTEVAETRWQSIDSSHQIPHSGRGARIAVGLGGKFVAVNRAVFNTESGEEIWSAPKAFGGGSDKDLLAVSPDGMIFIEGDDKGQVLTVYSKEKFNEETKREFPCSNDAKSLSFLQFIDGKRFVAAFGLSSGSRVAVYDIEKPKKPIKDFAAESVNSKTGAISPDGKYLAVASTQALKVYDLAKGTVAATMATPANGPLSFNSCTGVAFSPDMDEMSAVLGGGIVIWSNRGKLLEEIGGVVVTNPFNKNSGLHYLPDKSGWFVNGTLIYDRTKKMAIWQLDEPRGFDHPSCVFDANHILVSGGSDNNGQLVTAKIPREDVTKALKAIDDKVEAVLIPGGSISITYDMGEPRFAARQEVTNELHAVISKRLKDLGVDVQDNQPVTMKIVYTETAGQTLEFRDLIPGPGRIGPPAVTKVVDTNARLVAILTRKDDPKVWWTTTIARSSPHILNGEATEQNIRKQAFSNLKSSLGNVDIPRFLPVSDAVPSLPIRSDLGKL